MKRHFTYLLGFALLFAACSKPAAEFRLLSDLPAFHTLALDDSFEVVLVEGEAHSLKIEGDEKLIENVTAEVEDGELHVANESKWKWTKPRKQRLKITVTAPPLDLVVANKTCFISTQTPITSEEFGLVLKDKANAANLELNCNTFFYWNNFPCGGKLSLRGEVETLKLWNFALMTVDASELSAQFAEVDNASQGECAVRVSQRLNYSINGSGNIKLIGNPEEVNAGESSGPGILILD